jgi:hypothetical protein
MAIHGGARWKIMPEIGPLTPVLLRYKIAAYTRLKSTSNGRPTPISSSPQRHFSTTAHSSSVRSLGYLLSDIISSLRLILIQILNSYTKDIIILYIYINTLIF